jgi:hypothetical protein
MPVMDTLLEAKINDKSLLVAEINESRQLKYFLLGAEREVVDSVEFTTYRESVLDRKIYDWDDDGLQDIVEVRKYQGQMFSTITEVVYSIAGDAFRRIFSIETHELNCTTTDEDNNGIMLQRTYQRIEPGLFKISEIEGLVKCENDTTIPYNGNQFKITGRRSYEITLQELLRKYGQDYDIN